ncbi:pogo transposable element derived with ZNF domain b isoform X2 [Simochromis diagramma]|nr:pogo transposable element derived with ZNF domain b isoform X2 [Simochromis diagramma]XP_039886921.1 pogo transposable element derived with ZNF domain b isoform X2 [Simochromis diagramma]XP_039886922.1 pogo transposable element derived with ZNF domain b isoform X2 [Simochromis diagramma]XP_039886923.1 pogo transposable element derived with ZNF domain b isoform X2 [Simochromis diagramma]
MDTELFMECEEEELEPWQQVDDSVEEDDMDFMDNYGEPVEDSPSPLPVSETPPPRTPPTHHICCNSFITCPGRLLFLCATSFLCRLPPPPLPRDSLCLHGPRLMAQAPPLILTQTAGWNVPTSSGRRHRQQQPILLTTTQGFPVQTVVNPGAPLVLNLQPGQTVQPLTLIRCRSI